MVIHSVTLDNAAVIYPLIDGIVAVIYSVTLDNIAVIHHTEEVMYKFSFGNTRQCFLFYNNKKHCTGYSFWLFRKQCNSFCNIRQRGGVYSITSDTAMVFHSIRIGTVLVVIHSARVGNLTVIHSVTLSNVAVILSVTSVAVISGSEV